jgi:hypothetical protein
VLTNPSQELKKSLIAAVPGAKIEEKVGRLYIKGNHVQQVKKWLTDLGF